MNTVIHDGSGGRSIDGRGVEMTCRRIRKKHMYVRLEHDCNQQLHVTIHQAIRHMHKGNHSSEYLRYGRQY